MKKEDIERNYKEITEKIKNAKIYDGRGTFDIYTCQNNKCNNKIYTTCIDKGVTPFCIKCPECGEIMEHNKTILELPDGVLCKKWLRPSLDIALQMNDGQLDHLFQGGLFLEGDFKNF